MKAIIIAAALAIFGSIGIAGVPSAAEAAACPAVSHIVSFSYNPAGGFFGSNSLTWGNPSANSRQAWLLERSDDGGLTYSTVRVSTSRSINTGYLGPDVRYRVTGVSSAARPCSPDSTPFVWDPPAGGPFMTNANV